MAFMTRTRPPAPRGRAAKRGTDMANFVFWAMIVVVALAPLPLGANRPWSWSALGLAVGLLLVLWAVQAALDPTRVSVIWRRHGLATALFLLVIAWAALQVTGWLPATWHHPLWGEASAALGERLGSAVSLDPAAGMTVIMRLLTYAGVFWLALQFGRSERCARVILQTVAIAGFVYALYGLVVTLSGNETILWYDRWAYPDSLTSTFVNRNSFATYAGITMIAAIALLFSRHSDAPASPFSRDGVSALLHGFSSGGWFYLLIVGVAGAALILSHSRAGLGAAAIGLVVLFLGLLLGRRMTGAAFGFYAGAAALAAVLLIVLAGPSALRGLDRSIADERGMVFAYTTEAIADAPLTGTGLGTYPALYRLYRDGAIQRVYDKAHNTYLELAAELGVPATVVLIAVVDGLAMLCLVGARRRRRAQAFPAAGAAAAALVAAHSVVDFSLQIPAVSVTFAALLGAACAQAWPSEGQARRRASTSSAMSRATPEAPGRSGATTRDRSELHAG